VQTQSTDIVVGMCLAVMEYIEHKR
jgi:hypothetical protein